MRLALAAVMVLVGAGMMSSAAPVPASQPTSGPAVDPERINALILLIEDPQNTLEARVTGARELLSLNWPDGPQRLAAILGDGNAAARVGVAAALARWPQYLAPAYVDPLLEMLASTDAPVREAAAKALAAYRNGGVVPRLAQRVEAADQPMAARLGAIDALGHMTQRSAINALAEALQHDDPAIANAALVAMERATAMDFNEDVAAARRWWESQRELDDQQWQRRQIERLVRKHRATQARLASAEERLMRVLEANFQRAADGERGALLMGYLVDESPTIRMLGLRLIRAHMAEGKPFDSLPAELITRARTLMQSSEPGERAAAVQTVASFRQADDAERFIAALANEPHQAVRLALINGLGYVGDGAATRTLLEILEELDDEAVATEAVAALGRLAERGAQHEETSDQVVATLLRVFEQSRREQVVLRERVLWAMSHVAAPPFATAFASALDPAEAIAVRQAAVQGVRILNDAATVDALATAARDPDPGVRRAALETLAALGSTDVHLEALWSRTTNPPEEDESIQQMAWRGVLHMLSKRTPEVVEQWIERLPDGGAQVAQRKIELLRHLIMMLDDAGPQDRTPIGQARARIAALHVTLGQMPEALDAYRQALADLHGPNSEALHATAAELMRLALLNGRYDQTVAKTLSAGNPGPDHASLWRAVQAAVEPHMTAEHADKALTMLRAVRTHPPGAWPTEIAQQLEQRIAEAEALAKTPASQPTTAPA